MSRADDSITRTPPGTASGDGRRALALFVAVLLLASVARPTVLVAVPFLVLIALTGFRGVGSVLAVVLATVIVVSGSRDGIWFAERAWALTAGGAFAAIGMLRPAWTLSTRALTAVGVTVAGWAVFLAVRAGAWEALDWAIGDEFVAAYATWVDLLALAREGEPVSPAVSAVIYRTIELQTAMYPAILALQSMAALAVAWWLVRRFVQDRPASIGGLGGYRFNDHLVWLLITGLVLLVWRPDDAIARLGANLTLFMAALYTLRGLGVVLAVTGGLGLFGYALLTLGIVTPLAPFVVGVMAMFGVADTWLDLRARARPAVD